MDNIYWIAYFPFLKHDSLFFDDIRSLYDVVSMGVERDNNRLNILFKIVVVVS